MTSRCLSTSAVAFGLLFLVGHAHPVASQEQRPASPSHPTHVVVEPASIEWGPAPPAVPPEAEAVILLGDPAKAGEPFVIRLKAPDGYTVAPHWHPTTEHVTVIEGTLMVGLGDTFDEAALKTIPTGGFAIMPEKTNHFATFKDETTIQIHGVGPFDLTYVNPDDDPRKKTSS